MDLPTLAVSHLPCLDLLCSATRCPHWDLYPAHYVVLQYGFRGNHAAPGHATASAKAADGSASAILAEVEGVR